MEIFDLLNEFKYNVIRDVILYLVKKLNIKDNYKIEKLTKEYNALFIQWIFKANDMNKLSELYIPSDYIIDEDNIRYTFKQYNHPDMIVDYKKDNYFKFLDMFKRKSKKLKQLDKIQLDKIQLSENKEEKIFIYKKNSYKISNRIYNRLEKIYNGDPEYFITRAYMLLARYNSLGGLNINLGIPPNIIEYSYIELFGSPINTVTKYCSPFTDEKQYFNSLGSFFNYELESNTLYEANPPFNNDIINRMGDRLLSQLEKLENTTIIIILPVWDPETQKKLGKLKKVEEEFPIVDKLLNSKFIYRHEVLRKEEYLFYNYYTDKYVPIVDCHFIVLSSNNKSEYNIDNILNNWKNII